MFANMAIDLKIEHMPSYYGTAYLLHEYYTLGQRRSHFCKHNIPWATISRRNSIEPSWFDLVSAKYRSEPAHRNARWRRNHGHWEGTSSKGSYDGGLRSGEDARHPECCVACHSAREAKRNDENACEGTLIPTLTHDQRH